MLHTCELSDVSTGEFIDTWPLSHSLLAGETVNCCQHVEDLKAIGNSRYRNKSYRNLSVAKSLPGLSGQRQ